MLTRPTRTWGKVKSLPSYPRLKIRHGIFKPTLTLSQIQADKYPDRKEITRAANGIYLRSDIPKCFWRCCLALKLFVTELGRLNQFFSFTDEKFFFKFFLGGGAGAPLIKRATQQGWHWAVWCRSGCKIPRSSPHRYNSIFWKGNSDTQGVRFRLCADSRCRISTFRRWRLVVLFLCHPTTVGQFEERKLDAWWYSIGHCLAYMMLIAADVAHLQSGSFS